MPSWGGVIGRCGARKVLHLFLSPIIMLKYTSSVWASALLTYISIVCVMSLNLSALGTFCFLR